MFSKSLSDHVVNRPDSYDAIRSEAEKLMKNARSIGVFPTPIDELLAAADIDQISDVEEAKESFLKSLPKNMRAAFGVAFNKMRGFADLKQKVIYVAPEAKTARQAWVKLHELGHEVLPWQKVNKTYSDDDVSISPRCEEIFEKEANAFASEVLFQGKAFKEKASSYKPDFKSIFYLAEMHGASRHATARRFAEECDESIAVVTYYQSKYSVSSDGRPALNFHGGHSASEKLLKKFPDIQMPSRIEADHPWAQAIESGLVVSGSDSLDCGNGSSSTFMWESWWNGYTLFVLIRKTPKLKIVSSLLDI